MTKDENIPLKKSEVSEVACSTFYVCEGRLP